MTAHNKLHASEHITGPDAIPVVVGDSGSGGTKGLVPAPGAGDAANGKFLSAGGDYAVPPGAAAGDVVGPASATDGIPAIFDGVTGKLLKNGAQLYAIFDETAGVPAGVSEGYIWWDPDAHTLALRTDKGDVTLQVGQEDHDRVCNAGVPTIDNGAPVYLTGTVSIVGGEPCPDIGLAKADATGADVKKRRVFGIATHDIVTGTGIVTTRGMVRGLDTDSWDVGDELWLSETEGELTDTRPLLSASQVRCAIVMVKDVSDGVIAVRLQDLSWLGNVQAGNDAKERTGFVGLDQVAVDSGDNPLVVSADDSLLEFSIVPTSGSFVFYSINNLFVKVGTQTISFTDVEGGHFFYYDEFGVLTHTTVFSDTFVLGPDVFVGYLYWDATNKEIILDQPLQETHLLQMSGASHLHFHETLGAQVKQGFTLNSIIDDGNGNVNTHAQYGVDSGIITDEDLAFSIAAQNSTTDEKRLLYLDGAGALVRQTTQPSDTPGEFFPVLTDVQAGVGATGRLVYNNWTGAVWELVAVSINDYVLSHCFAIGIAGGGEQIYYAIGQADYSNILDARDGAETEMGNLVVSLPFAEVRPLASVIFQTGGYSNDVQSRVRPIDINTVYVDWRKDAIPGGTGFSPTTHNDLSGRSAAGAHPASAITSLPWDMTVAVSDEVTDLVTGTAKVTFRMPRAITLNAGDAGVRANVNTAPTGSAITVDINEGGVSILSTPLTIDDTEKTSLTAAVPVVISDVDLADDAEMTVDIDGIGSTIPGDGLKITLRGVHA